MTLAEMERRCVELKEQYNRGAITEEEFRSGMNELRFRDASSRWWTLGAQSSKWYMFDGTRWVPGAPPEIPVAPRAVAEPEPIPQERFAPQSFETEPQPFPETQTVSAPPESVTMLIRRRKERRRSPTRLSILLGAGAIAAMLFVFAALIAVETFVPGKPISSFLARTFGGASTQVAPLAPSSGLPANVIAMVNAGDQIFAAGQMDSAIAQYQRAAQAAPSNAIPLTRLARVVAFKGQIQDAVARARQAVKIAPNDAEANAQLCRALTWSSQIDEATKVCEGAIKLDSKNVNAHAFLTETYLHAQRVPDAKAQAVVALQLEPQSAEAHRAQAWVLTLSGQKDAAIAEWKQAVNLEPNLFYRHYEIAQAQRVFFNASAEAVPSYQKSLALYGAYVPAMINLGIAFLDVNQPQNAIPQLRRAATLDPNNVEAIANLGAAYQKSNQCSQAIPYFEQALKLDANNSTAQRGLNECKSGQPPGPRAAPAAPTAPLLPPTAVPAGQ